MSSIKHAIIAAAGMGVRMGMGYPKCLIKLGDKPLIIHILERLQDVADIRIVVGFEHEKVVDVVRQYRDDVIFVLNTGYKFNTTLTSYIMGCRHIEEKCLFLDGDIYFTPKSFDFFTARCDALNEPIIGTTRAKTDDAVFVEIDDLGNVESFSRDKKTDMEWANIAWLPPKYLKDENQYVFEQLARNLPIKACNIDSYEVDTPDDLKRANQHYETNMSKEVITYT